MHRAIAAILVLLASTYAGFAAGPSLRLVPLPPDLSRDDVLYADEAVRQRLIELARSHLARGAVRGDVVVLVDHAGRPILPDLDDPRPRAAGTNDLTFTFNSPTDPWSPNQLGRLEAALDDFYPLIKEIYGPPALVLTVNVRNDSDPFAGAFYLPSLNEMVLPGVDLEAFAHEIVHAFRDDFVVELDTFEEGMARATEIEVFNRLPAYLHSGEAHSNHDDVHYESLNREAIGSIDGEFSGALFALKYRLTAYAWAKGLIEDPAFFRNFNAEYFSRAFVDVSIRSDEEGLVELAARVLPTVEGEPFAAWYDGQSPLATDPPLGEFLYPLPHDFAVYYALRNDFGIVELIANQPVEWQVLDHEGAVLDTGVVLSSPFGAAFFSPEIPQGYRGRLEVVVATDGGLLESGYRAARSSVGVFGVIDGADRGTVFLAPVQGFGPVSTVDVVDGAFAAPAMESFRGKLSAVYTGPDGSVTVRQLTKDASAYFVTLDAGR